MFNNQFNSLDEWLIINEIWWQAKCSKTCLKKAHRRHHILSTVRSCKHMTLLSYAFLTILWGTEWPGVYNLYNVTGGSATYIYIHKYYI